MSTSTAKLLSITTAVIWGCDPGSVAPVWTGRGRRPPRRHRTFRSGPDRVRGRRERRAVRDILQCGALRGHRRVVEGDSRRREHQRVVIVLARQSAHSRCVRTIARRIMTATARLTNPRRFGQIKAAIRFGRTVSAPLAPSLSLRKAGTHAPCPLDGLRSMGPTFAHFRGERPEERHSTQCSQALSSLSSHRLAGMWSLERRQVAHQRSTE